MGNRLRMLVTITLLAVAAWTSPSSAQVLE